MNFNTDGFNERSIYIHNSNDANRLKQNGTSNIDNSMAKMRVKENKPDVETVNTDKSIYIEETKGNRENFILRNNNLNNFNRPINQNNPVSRAMNNNMFKRNR